MQDKVLADKVTGPEIKPEKEEQEEQYVDELEKKDKSNQANALSFQMARVIRWNLLGLYQQKAHRILKKSRRIQILLLEMKTGRAVVYKEAIPDRNFKSLFKSMVINQNDLQQVAID